MTSQTLMSPQVMGKTIVIHAVCVCVCVCALLSFFIPLTNDLHSLPPPSICPLPRSIKHCVNEENEGMAGEGKNTPTIDLWIIRVTEHTHRGRDSEVIREETCYWSAEQLHSRVSSFFLFLSFFPPFLPSLLPYFPWLESVKGSHH